MLEVVPPNHPAEYVTCREEGSGCAADVLGRIADRGGRWTWQRGRNRGGRTDLDQGIALVASTDGTTTDCDDRLEQLLTAWSRCACLCVEEAAEHRNGAHASRLDRC